MMGGTLDILTSGSEKSMSIKHFDGGWIFGYFDVIEHWKGNWLRKCDVPVPKKNIEKPFAFEDGTDILTASSELWMIGGTDAKRKIEGGGLSMGRVDSF